MNKLISFMFFMLFTISSYASMVVATVNGTPVTDTDITARTTLMARQGKTSTDNRVVALQNIIDDYVKLSYAENYGVNPTDKDADGELKRMEMNDLEQSELAMARQAVRAEIAWQVIIAKTIVPMVEVSASDVKAEKIALARDQGLPIEMTIIRLVDIPKDVAKKLSKPSDCDDAMSIAEHMGGEPQRFTALQYELAPEIRERVADLPELTWSPIVDKSVLLVCSTTKTSEYGKLDDIIKQNAEYKQAMNLADQKLKQLRRKAVVIINDERYKL